MAIPVAACAVAATYTGLVSLGIWIFSKVSEATVDRSLNETNKALINQKEVKALTGQYPEYTPKGILGF